jgi:hypothetical protein
VDIGPNSAGYADLAVGRLIPVLALLFVPGLVVAGTTLLIDLVWARRKHLDFGHVTSIADEAQRWLETQ